LSPTVTLKSPSPMREKINQINTLLDDLIEHNADPNLIDALDMLVAFGNKLLSGDDDIAVMDISDFNQRCDDWRQSADELVELAQAEQMRLLEVA
jgi:hypothetical protein